MRVDLSLKEVLGAFPIGREKKEKIAKAENNATVILPSITRDLDATVSIYLKMIRESNSPYERQGLLNELEQLLTMFGRSM